MAGSASKVEVCQNGLGGLYVECQFYTSAVHNKHFSNNEIDVIENEDSFNGKISIRSEYMIPISWFVFKLNNQKPFGVEGLWF